MKINFRWWIALIIMGFIIIMMFLTTLPDGRTLRVTFCNVGQGDAAYLRFPNGQDMLIDGGPDGSILACLGKAMPFWDMSLDVVVITHPELDHFGGIIPVVERFHIGMLLVSGINNSSVEYQHLVATIQKQAIPLRILAGGDYLTFHSIKLSWLWPSRFYQDAIISRQVQLVPGDQTIAESKNDVSQVILLTYQQIQFLFTGDISTTVESDLFRYLSGNDQMIEVLKVPHHGSRTSMTKDFLTWLKPHYAVISSGKHNHYGHPSPETLDLLSQFGVDVFRTDEGRDITMTTDGHFLSITK